MVSSKMILLASSDMIKISNWVSKRGKTADDKYIYIFLFIYLFADEVVKAANNMIIANIAELRDKMGNKTFAVLR